MARLLEVSPDAGARSSISHIGHATDISELRPPDSEPAPATTSNPKVAAAMLRTAGSEAGVRAAAKGPSIADTANPASAEPPSSSEEGVLVFESRDDEARDGRAARQEEARVAPTPYFAGGVGSVFGAAAAARAAFLAARVAFDFAADAAFAAAVLGPAAFGEIRPRSS